MEHCGEFSRTIEDAAMPRFFGCDTGREAESTPRRTFYLLFCLRSALWLGNACSACLAEMSGPGTRIVM